MLPAGSTVATSSLASDIAVINPGFWMYSLESTVMLPHGTSFRIVLSTCIAYRRILVKSVLSLMLSLAFVSTGFAQQGRGGRGAGPEPRIVSFEARPGSIRPGESALLVWSTENPAGLSIDPEVGPV